MAVKEFEIELNSTLVTSSNLTFVPPPTSISLDLSALNLNLADGIDVNFTMNEGFVREDYTGSNQTPIPAVEFFSLRTPTKFDINFNSNFNKQTIPSLTRNVIVGEFNAFAGSTIKITYQLGNLEVMKLSGFDLDINYLRFRPFTAAFVSNTNINIDNVRAKLFKDINFNSVFASEIDNVRVRLTNLDAESNFNFNIEGTLFTGVIATLDSNFGKQVTAVKTTEITDTLNSSFGLEVESSRFRDNTIDTTAEFGLDLPKIDNWPFDPFITINLNTQGFLRTANYIRGIDQDGFITQEQNFDDIDVLSNRSNLRRYDYNGNTIAFRAGGFSRYLASNIGNNKIWALGGLSAPGESQDSLIRLNATTLQNENFGTTAINNISGIAGVEWSQNVGNPQCFSDGSVIAVGVKNGITGINNGEDFVTIVYADDADLANHSSGSFTMSQFIELPTPFQVQATDAGPPVMINDVAVFISKHSGESVRINFVTQDGSGSINVNSMTVISVTGSVDFESSLGYNSVTGHYVNLQIFNNNIKENFLINVTNQSEIIQVPASSVAQFIGVRSITLADYYFKTASGNEVEELPNFNRVGRTNNRVLNAIDLGTERYIFTTSSDQKIITISKDVT